MSSPLVVLPRFATFGTQRHNIVDEFSQQFYYIMQFSTRQGHDKGAISFGLFNTEAADEGIWNPYAKFEIEDASTKGGMVHIKSCYNHKYLRRASDDPQMIDIRALADEPEEDTSKWFCTLFKLVWRDPMPNAPAGPAPAGYELWLQHNGGEMLVQALWRAHLPDGPMMMVVSRDHHQSYTRFDVFDLDRLPILPRILCLKADNDRYLRIDGTQASFTGRDRRELETQFEVVYTRYRSVVLRPVALPSSYLVRNASNVYEASTNVSNRRNAPLEPVLLDFAGPPVVAFKSLTSNPNHAFIERRNVGNLANAFAIGRPGTILPQAEFNMEDTVRSRQLSNVQFHYDDMHILEPSPVAVLTKRVRNGSAVSTQEAHLSFRYSEYESSHWETTHSWQVDVSFGFQTVVSARLPLLKFIRVGVETTYNVDVSAGYQGEHNVGETKVQESEMTTSFTLRVPPMTESLVNMVVSRAKIQLPYSYTQREALQDGSTQSSKKVDGLYEGEATHVDYDVEESSI